MDIAEDNCVISVLLLQEVQDLKLDAAIINKTELKIPSQILGKGLHYLVSYLSFLKERTFRNIHSVYKLEYQCLAILKFNFNVVIA